MENSRRKFILQLGTCFAGLTAIPAILKKTLANLPEPIEPYLREAHYYKKLDNKKVQCLLCPKQCVVSNNKRGYCEVRENQNGIYKTLVYGRLCTIHQDPIEKKPLFHFLPGTTAVSVATAGCNVECKFCQNWNIAQVRPEDISFTYVSPEELVNITKYHKSPTIAYTYNEPTIFTEYICDTASAGREKGIHSVMISNGFIKREPMSDLCNVLDAIKIDFKAFSEKFYREIVSGTMKPVLDTMVFIKEQGKWLEIVNLVIPTHNDDKNQIKEMCKWIKQNLGPDVPVHFTRFHPQYLMKNLPPTPVKTLEMAYNIACDAGINFAYVGNVPGHPAENTICPSCRKILIERTGYFIRSNNIINSKCRFCQTSIPGVWS